MTDDQSFSTVRYDTNPNESATLQDITSDQIYNQIRENPSSVDYKKLLVTLLQCREDEQEDEAFIFRQQQMQQPWIQTEYYVDDAKITQRKHPTSNMNTEPTIEQFNK